LRLETERLVLRLPEAADVPDYFAMWSDEETARFVGGTQTLEETRGIVERQIRHWDWFGAGLFTVVRKEDERFLGRVGLLFWDPARWISGHRERVSTPCETEIGWTLGREHWGRGYATEGALACRDWALEELGLTRLISMIVRANAASIRVAEKIGESYEREIQGGFFRNPVGLWSLDARMAP
jgi:RimJ/RimL family protein N-acetyltransferase